MARSVDYYFSLVSPWAYIGHSTFMDLARREQKTAILVTHQLEEAIELGGRILVFGRPGHVLADIRLTDVPPREIRGLRAHIQQMLQSNRAIPGPITSSYEGQQ